MGNRSILCGAATVEVDMTRYDELIRKEEKLNIITSIMGNRYTPVEVIRVIINDVSGVNQDEDNVDDVSEVANE